MRSLQRVTFCLCALLAAGRASAAAQSTRAPQPDWAPNVTPELTVAMGGSYWPLHADALGVGRDGLEADLAEDLARLLGMEVQFVGSKETGVGSIEAVAAGKADIAIASITPTHERRKLVDFTKPYLVLHYRMVAREAEAASAVEPAGKKVAVPRGPAVAVAKALHPRANVVEVASPDAAVLAVLRRKADLAFGEDVGMLLAIRGRPARLVGPPQGESPIAIAVPKGQAARYDEALAKLSGRIKELVAKYAPGEPPAMPDVVYLYFGGIGEAAVALEVKDLKLSRASPEPEVEWQTATTDSVEVQVNVPARRVGAPRAILRLVEGKFRDAQFATWLELPDGTLIGLEATPECGGECGRNETAYRIVAFRRGVLRSKDVHVLTGT